MPSELVEDKPIWFRVSNAAGVGMATCSREREAEETARMLQSLTGEVYTINRVSLSSGSQAKKN